MRRPRLHRLRPSKRPQQRQRAAPPADPATVTEPGARRRSAAVSWLGFNDPRDAQGPGRPVGCRPAPVIGGGSAGDRDGRGSTGGHPRRVIAGGFEPVIGATIRPIAGGAPRRADRRTPLDRPRPGRAGRRQPAPGSTRPAAGGPAGKRSGKKGSIRGRRVGRNRAAVGNPRKRSKIALIVLLSHAGAGRRSSWSPSRPSIPRATRPRARPSAPGTSPCSPSAARSPTATAPRWPSPSRAGPSPPGRRCSPTTPSAGRWPTSWSPMPAPA